MRVMPNLEVVPPETLRPYRTDMYAIQYHRNVGDLGTTKVPPEYASVDVLPIEEDAMGVAFDLAEGAMKDGNPPVGAVLIVEDERLFGARTADWSQSKLNGHGEIIAYEDAQPVVGRDLSASTLVTTAVLCSSCAPIYAEGKARKVITAAPRTFVWQLTGKMRPRVFNQHDAFADGDTETLSIMNYQLDRALGLFALYGQMDGYVHPEPVDEILASYITNAQRQRTFV